MSYFIQAMSFVMAVIGIVVCRGLENKWPGAMFCGIVVLNGDELARDVWRWWRVRR